MGAAGVGGGEEGEAVQAGLESVGGGARYTGEMDLGEGVEGLGLD